MALAAGESAGVLIEDRAAVEFMCQALRGDSARWHDFPDLRIEDVLEAAHYHGVLALLADRARRSEAWAGWPERLRRALDEAGRNAVAHEMLRSHHLERLLGCFEGSGIRYLLTKGAALAHTHYDTPGTRTRSDSDVFIPMNDIEAARAAVTEAGFQVVTPVYKSHQFTVACSGDSGAVTRIDVHWRILNAPRFARTFSFDELFETSIEMPAAATGRMLDTVHALLLACMHRAGSARHDPDRLIWLYDIHVLFSGMTDVERAEFGALARERGVQACCRDGLDRARQHFHTDVPAGVTAGLQRPETRPGLRERLRQSHLALLADDWRRLRDWQSRRNLLRELFAPPADSILLKYGKTDRRWLPLLYARQIVSGLAQRMQLK